MFLRPQHFQAADRFWTELIHTSARWDNPYNYGVSAIELSEEALSNYQVQVTRCHARMKDGTLVVLDAGQEPDRVDLKGAFTGQTEVRVYLAIPKLTLGRGNVGAAGADENPRYLETELPVPDESRGGNEQALQFRDHNVRLLLSTDDLAGYEVLPIAQVKRASEGEATPLRDDDYFPPMLTTASWPPLGLGVVRAIYDIIGQKMEILSERIVQRGVTLASQEPGDLEDLMMLMVLNESYATLSCLAFAAVHPFQAYTELCRVVGQLSIFDELRRTPDVPRYDHDDLARIFKWIRIEIERLIGSRRKLEYEQRFFHGADRGMQVTIDPKWLHSGWKWFVGVNGQGVSEAEIRELLRPGNLDWKMGSAQQVDLIFKHGIPGVTLVDLPQPPRALPSRQGWTYYEVRRENAAWNDVLATQTLALRFTEELISNLDTLQGQRKLEVAAKGKRTVLEIALFAVPSQQA
jgi:type VI secretion system protein ImpJ